MVDCPISFAPWLQETPHVIKRDASLYLTLFFSENLYKCNTYVIPTFLNLETDSFKVTLWILFIHIPWFYHNLFWQALPWRLVPHSHNPKGEKLDLLIQSQKYFIFQLLQKHPLYFPSTFFYSEFNSNRTYVEPFLGGLLNCFQLPNKVLCITVEYNLTKYKGKTLSDL